MNIHMFQVDQLSLLMLGIISFIGLPIIFFSKKYLEGNAGYFKFFGRLFILLSTTALMVISDHILVFLASYALSNTFLSLAMIHNKNWQVALVSGKLAAKNFVFSCAMVSLALLLLYSQTQETSIYTIVHSSYEYSLLLVALILLTLGAMAQSAIWPFYRWLTSSLNSPTPVSAVMHAGLINGGGFILAKFALLYIKLPEVLNFLFILGVITVLLGNIWKLIQSNIKTMLACSTMAQMGFMFMQCGLGLFPAAIAHICWHSFFKAYLFLGAGSAALEQRKNITYSLNLLTFTLSLICGICASIIFNLITKKTIADWDSNIVLTFICLMAGTQFSINLISKAPLKNFIPALSAAILLSTLYGLSVHSIELIVEPLKIMYPQPLNLIHITFMGLIFLLWLIATFSNNLNNLLQDNVNLQKLYVFMLNLSQPHQQTITTHRNHYRTI